MGPPIIERLLMNAELYTSTIRGVIPGLWFKRQKRFVFAAMLLLFPALLQAHSFWLNATTYTPAQSRGAYRTTIYAGFGDMAPVHDFLAPEKLTQFSVISPDGTTKLVPGKEGFLATPVSIPKAGAHIVCGATTPGLYTMYVKDGRVHHAFDGFAGHDSVVLSLYYENYARALIAAGDTDSLAFSRPTGQALEVIPMVNPYTKRTGDMLGLRVVHNGTPAPFCRIDATWVGFSDTGAFAYATKTNSKGNASIRLLHQGQWIVFATVRKPAGPEHRDKAREEKYTASLSFSVK